MVWNKGPTWYFGMWVSSCPSTICWKTLLSPLDRSLPTSLLGWWWSPVNDAGSVFLSPEGTGLGVPCPWNTLILSAEPSLTPTALLVIGCAVFVFPASVLGLRHSCPSKDFCNFEFVEDRIGSHKRFQAPHEKFPTLLWCWQCQQFLEEQHIWKTKRRGELFA